MVSRIRAIVVQIGLQRVQMLQTRGHLRFTITHFQVVPPLDAHTNTKREKKIGTVGKNTVDKYRNTVEQFRNTVEKYT